MSNDLLGRFAGVVSLVMLISGCATSFQKPATQADYGTPPSNYESTIKAVFSRTLKDSESARFHFAPPVKAYANNGLFHGGHVVWAGYLVDFQINAKNSFGAYIGYKSYIALFKGDVVIKVIEGKTPYLLHRVE